MAYFVYSARDRSGASVNGDMEADTSAQVADRLLQRGMTPLKISESAKPTGDTEVDLNSLSERWFAPKVKIEDVIMLSRQLRTLLKAGVPILRGLLGLADTVENKSLAKALREVHQQLQSGLSLSAAMSKHQSIFSPLFIALVKVGEDTGQLDRAFAHLADYLLQEKDTAEKIKAATRYPITVMFAILVAVVIINVWIIPSFANTFARYGSDLPLLTQILMTTSDMFVYGWPFLLALLVGGFVGGRMWLMTENGRYQYAKWTLAVPLIGPILRKAILSRLAQSLSMVMRSGVPLAQGLVVVADVVGNAYVSKSVMQMREKITNGESVTRAAAATGLFTPLVLQMIAVGEESGALDELLEETAHHYHDEVSYEVSKLSEAIEPIVITIIGVMVTILALGVFLPMWDMASIARGG